jgi:hypothetical protein
METTENLSLPYLMPSQAQKHVTHNEALRALDALVQLSVASRNADAPPDSPLPGARYVVPVGATGAWAGHADAVAAWQDGDWMFYPPQQGWLAVVLDEELLLYWDGDAWADFVATASALQNLKFLGINATADAVNRLALSGEASLFSHEGAGHRLKVNKAGAADTASVLFQTGWSGRAEFGLAGDDDFHVKVSADGSNFAEAMRLDRTTGRASFPAGVAGMREQLSADRTYYVALDGSDTNDGRSAASAFATLQKAVDEAGKLDCSVFDVTIHLAAGAYAGADVERPLFGGGMLRIMGDDAAPEDVVLNSSLGVRNGAVVSVSGVKIDIPVDWQHGIDVGAAASVEIGAVVFGTVGTGADHIFCDGPCRITIVGDYIIAGSARRHISAANSGVVNSVNRTVTLTGTPGFDQFFCANNGGVISLWDAAFSGAATGTRYVANTNGVINLYGKAADFLPGDAAGTTTSGGIYV